MCTLGKVGEDGSGLGEIREGGGAYGGMWGRVFGKVGVGGGGSLVKCRRWGRVWVRVGVGKVGVGDGCYQCAITLCYVFVICRY
jgi:hypothetical protein